jgi:hypothetical protein
MGFLDAFSILLMGVLEDNGARFLKNKLIKVCWI